MKKTKLGSDLVVQRSRCHHFEVFFEIYKMRMVSWLQDSNKNQRNGNVKLKKLGSDLVVQRSRYHHFEVFFEIYKMSMVSGP